MGKERELLEKFCNSSWVYSDWLLLKIEAEKLLAQPEQEHVGIVRTIGGYLDESDHIAEWTCSFKYLKDGDRLYLAPPKCEPLNLYSIDRHLEINDYSDEYKHAYCEGIKFAEKEHGIGG